MKKKIHLAKNFHFSNFLRKKIKTNRLLIVENYESCNKVTLMWHFTTMCLILRKFVHRNMNKIFFCVPPMQLIRSFLISWKIMKGLKRIELKGWAYLDFKHFSFLLPLRLSCHRFCLRLSIFFFKNQPLKQRNNWSVLLRHFFPFFSKNYGISIFC